jgi:hypothetical protein
MRGDIYHREQLQRWARGDTRRQHGDSHAFMHAETLFYTPPTRRQLWVHQGRHERHHFTPVMAAPGYVVQHDVMCGCHRMSVRQFTTCDALSNVALITSGGKEVDRQLAGAPRFTGARTRACATMCIHCHLAHQVLATQPT